MKKLLSSLFVFLLVAVSYSSVGKLDPRLGRIVVSPSYRQQLAKSLPGPTIPVVITFAGDPDELKAAGVRVLAIVDDIVAAEVPIAELEAVSNLPGLVYMEASTPDHPLLDKSLPIIRVTDARQRLGVTGKGVLIGIIDSGIDWQHDDFRRPDGKTRIKCILDLSRPGPHYGGTVYQEQDINDALSGLGSISQRDRSGHGTHVAGIAAGDGSATSQFGTYAGVAPEAELVIVKATRDDLGSEFQTADQIVALKFIDSVATALGKPYVTNLSFGGHYGGHDGTSPVERTIKSLAGPGIPGKAIVTVAGNDRNESVHAAVSLSGSRTVNEITFRVQDYSAASGIDNDKIQLDGWYPGDKSVSLTLITPSGTTIGPVSKGNFKEQDTGDGSVYLWNGLYENGQWLYPGVNPFNGDNEFFVQISDKQANREPAAGTWTLRLAGTGGRIDLWKSHASMPVVFEKGNSDDRKVSIPGTAENSITTGAFVTKRTWRDADGNNLTLDPDNILNIGGLADFTSPGPTRDGRLKPEITAPGQIIASSLSADAMPWEPASIFVSSAPEYPNAFLLEGYTHGLNSGTSMAAPHVSGTIALLFEKYPQASAEQVKTMLIESSQRDNYVGAVPNNDWGWGKINAFAALQTEPGEEAAVSYQMKEAYPNPFSISTTIEFDIPVARADVYTTVRVYNVLGRLVKELLASTGVANRNKVYWDARDSIGYPVASGVYFIEFVSGKHREVKKIAYIEPKAN